MQRNTRDEIKQVCLKLLEDKPLDQITVKAIVQECGINRNSFYYHYADITTLLNEIVLENANRIISEHAKAKTLEECLAAATEFARENKRAVLHVFKSANRNIYEQNLAMVCHDLVVAYWRTILGDDVHQISQEDRDIMVRFYQCEMMGQILLWLESDMRYDIQKQFARLCELREGFGPEMIRRSKESNGIDC